MMVRMRRGDVARQPEAAPPPARPPMKPIVITRETLKVLKIAAMLNVQGRIYFRGARGANNACLFSFLHAEPGVWCWLPQPANHDC